ncbi:MAG: glycosyltransferase [Ruminococcus sp.]|jgi:glycosyltransferase involved in cell wall biosynthesis
MDGNIKVSVIIPVYQVEKYLERAVDSVLAQTLKELEIILVDDGSEDASGIICDRYAKEYPGLIRVIHKENEGLGMARNTGVREARGEYVAFLDSDDTVDSQMYQEMYEKASEEQYDIVMCDVRILYVEENRESVVKTFPEEEVDLAEYLVKGNNITYSVNKLYARRIWKEQQYEKMLFEDIALIPALVTRYPHIGYVSRPFYHYYRRANTISTTFSGDMVDIVQAFRDFIEKSDPAYREEVIYCTARQLFWNMTQSRILFQADFIGLLKEYKKDFLMNSYIAGDQKIRKILDFIDQEVIPEHLICISSREELPPEFLEAVKEHFPKADLTVREVTGEEKEHFPPSVRRALGMGNMDFVREYAGLKILYEQGGILLKSDMRVRLNLKKLRMYPIFFGFENEEDICGGCFGALKEHYVIRALLDSYEEDNIYNKALLPLEERIRDLLILHFGLNPNGRNQRLKGGIQVWLPSVLAFDMQDGENCCKKVPAAVPEGYELVSDRVLKLWSQRLMENWNLYKRERDQNQKGGKKDQGKTEERSHSGVMPDSIDMQEQIRQVVESYENSTCWKITRPIRALAGLFGK